MFNPLIYDTYENGANNLSEAIWDSAEVLVHYGALHMAYYSANVAYSAAKAVLSPVKWSLSLFSSKNEAPVVAPVAPSKGKLGMVIDFLRWLPQSHLVFLWGSDALYRNYTQSLMAKMKVLGVAFLRPVIEKWVPSIYEIFDKNDLNANLRMFAVGGEGTWPTWAATPAYIVRDGINHMITTRTWANDNQRYAYALGISFAETAEETLKTMRDVIYGATQLGPCLLEAPKTNFKCMKEGWNYFGTTFTKLHELSAPLREAASAWAKVGLEAAATWSKVALETAATYAKAAPSLALDYGNQLLWSNAEGVKNYTGVPSIATYSLQVAGVTGLSLFLGYHATKGAATLIGHAGREFISSIFRRPQAVVNNNNNNNLQNQAQNQNPNP